MPNGKAAGFVVGETGSDEKPKEPSSLSIGGGLKALVRSLKDDAEAKEIQRVMEETNWNRKLTAARLGISDKALRYKVKQHGISADSGIEQIPKKQ